MVGVGRRRCIIRPPDKESYGYNALSLMYCALDPLRFNMVALFLIACEELGHISVPRQMRKCRSDRGGCTSRAVDAWAHMVCSMVHDCMALSFDVQWCMDLCHEVQGYEVECRGVYLCEKKHDDAQMFVEVFPPERSPNEGIRKSIGFGTLKCGE